MQWAVAAGEEERRRAGALLCGTEPLSGAHACLPVLGSAHATCGCISACVARQAFCLPQLR